MKNSINSTPTQLSLAKDIFEYLYISSDSIPHADVIIGFGHFDLKIPQQCGRLYQHGAAERIIFTGGIGSGTADLGKAEAVAFAEELRKTYPSLPDDIVILEDSSTNTSENIQFTIQKLQTHYPNFTFNNQIVEAILVANAYRQRRVFLTCRRNLPQVRFYNAPPKTAFEEEFQLFSSKEQDLIDLLIGEIDRLIRYGEKGYLLQEKIPEDIYSKCLQLRTDM